MIAHRELAPRVHELTAPLRVAPGFTLPARCTVLGLDDGTVAVVSPLLFDDDAARAIEALGAVSLIVAPNRYHHLFAGQAKARWPAARLVGAPGLAEKRRDLALEGVLGEAGALPQELEAIVIEGAASVGEVALAHHATRTLVVTDLVFHVLAPEGALTPWILRAVGAHGKLAQGVEWRLFTRDRGAAAASVARVLAFEADRLLMGHGEPVVGDVRARLSAALAWMRGPNG
ncbi:MAG: hypothetical protein JNL38_21960 [Myxococcales bacterium]|nr:hypothetical protein [Myxococcales bacterium]